MVLLLHKWVFFDIINMCRQNNLRECYIQFWYSIIGPFEWKAYTSKSCKNVIFILKENILKENILKLKNFISRHYRFIFLTLKKGIFLLTMWRFLGIRHWIWLGVRTCYCLWIHIWKGNTQAMKGLSLFGLHQGVYSLNPARGQVCGIWWLCSLHFRSKQRSVVCVLYLLFIFG